MRPNPTRFFGLNSILDQKFGLSLVELALRVKKRVQSGRVGLKKGFKFGFNPIMYLINPIWVGPPGSKFGLSHVGLVGFITTLARIPGI